MASIIESNLTIDGNLKCDGDLIINGRVHGDVTAKNLTVSDNGCLQGNIYATIVESNGTIAGNITATAINLGENSNTHASVKVEEANIKDGALVVGQLKIGLTMSQSSKVQKPSLEPSKVSAS